MNIDEIIDYALGVETSHAAQLPLTDFKHKIYRRYEHPKHLELLDDALTQIALYVATAGKQGIGRLLVEMPPRHGKSFTVSKLFPAWFVGNNPDYRVMNVSYGARLAEKNSRWVRNVLRSKAWASLYPHVQLARDSKSVETWAIEGREGGMDALGIDGAATGSGAHILNIDDPFKNRQQAESVTYRERVWDAYTDDYYTRLEPGGAIIVTQTRWHEDDLIGRLVAREKGNWTRLRLPALAEDNDPLGRKTDAALWPQRYDKQTLLKTRATLGEYSFSALYQQNPVPAEGGIFKRSAFIRVNDVPTLRFTVRFWDLAMSAKTSADYTVGVKMGVDDAGNVYVLDVIRVQMEWPDVVPMLRQQIALDGRHVVQGIEQQGFMSRAVQDLAGDRSLYAYTIKGYPTDKDKLTRALPFAARVGNGQVFVLWRGGSAEYVDELTSFPNALHDDQVDASSGAFAMLDEPQSTFSVTSQKVL